MPKYWTKIARIAQHQSLLVLVCLMGFSYALSFPSHPDVQWLTHEANVLFGGGHYMTQFIDPNPPLILLVYQPINVLARLLPLPLHGITVVYLYLCVVLSVLRCRSILIHARSHALPSLTLVFIAIMLAIYPMSNAGQRECLMLTFSMPYLLSCCIGDKEKPTHHRWDTSFACLGFLLKMQYILIPLCIEAYFYFSKKKQQHTYRVFIAATVLYVLAIYLVTPRYWSDILPMIKHYYAGHYGFIKACDYYLLPSTLTLCLGFITSCVSVFLLKASSANRVLLIAFGVSLLNYLLPQQVFLYHRVPVETYWLALSFLLVFQLLSERDAWQKKPKQSIAILLNCFLVAALSVTDIINTSSQTDYYREYRHFTLPKKVTRIYPLLITATRSELSTLQQGRANCSRMASLWLLMYFVDKTELSAKETAMKKSIHRWVVDDIQNCQPQAILIENQDDFKAFTLRFFNDDPRFRAIWKHYHFHHRNGHVDIYTRTPHVF